MRLLFLIFAALPLFGQTPISACGTYGPGSYVLTTSLDGLSATNCLDFEGPGEVQLTGAGFTVQGTTSILVNNASGFSFVQNVVVGATNATHPGPPFNRYCPVFQPASCTGIVVTGYTAGGVPGNKLLLQNISSTSTSQYAMSVSSSDTVQVANSQFSGGLSLNTVNGLTMSGVSLGIFNYSFPSTNVFTQALLLQNVTNSTFTGLTITGDPTQVSVGKLGLASGISFYGAGNTGNTISNSTAINFASCAVLFTDDGTQAGSLNNTFIGNIFTGTQWTGGTSTAGFCYNDPSNPGGSTFDLNRFQGNQISGVQYGFLMAGEQSFTRNQDSTNIYQGSIAPVKNELYTSVPSGGAFQNTYASDSFQLNNNLGTPDFCGGGSSCALGGYVQDGGGNIGLASTQTNYPLVLSAPSLGGSTPPANPIPTIAGYQISSSSWGLSPLPTGIAGNSYGPLTYLAFGGSGNYTWSASGLPSGLSLSSSGILSGTPGGTGTFSATITVFDATYTTSSSITASVVINAGLSLPNKYVIPYPTAQIGVPYSIPPPDRTGGVSPCTWSATNLPPGITIDSSAGTVSGTALGPPQTYNTSVIVTCADGAASTYMPITVVPQVNSGQITLNFCDVPGTPQINTAGITYVLASSINNFSGGSCLTIGIPQGSPNIPVTLDCQGYSVTSGTGSALEYRPAFLNDASTIPVTVRNCQFLTADTGTFVAFPTVLVSGVSNFTFTGNTVGSSAGPFYVQSLSITGNNVNTVVQANQVFGSFPFTGNSTATIANNTFWGGGTLNNGSYQVILGGTNITFAGNLVAGECGDGTPLDVTPCQNGGSLPDSDINLGGVPFPGQSGNSNITITNNTLNGATASGGIEIATFPLSNITIDSNHISGFAGASDGYRGGMFQAFNAGSITSLAFTNNTYAGLAPMINLCCNNPYPDIWNNSTFSGNTSASNAGLPPPYGGMSFAQAFLKNGQPSGSGNIFSNNTLTDGNGNYYAPSFCMFPGTSVSIPCPVPITSSITGTGNNCANPNDPNYPITCVH